jgi:hypothetical protein
MPTPRHYLMAGELIVARLRSQVRELRAVESIELIDQATEAKAVGPLGFVAYDGDEVVEGAGRARQGASQLVRQRWLVIVALRSAAQGRAAAQHEEAGPLLSATVDALAAWECAPFRAPMVRVSAPRVDYGKNWTLYPLMFAGELMTS